MKCELCHNAPATTVIYRTVSGKTEKEELYVCKACAQREAAFGQERGMCVATTLDDLPDGPPKMTPPPFIQNLISKLSKLPKVDPKALPPELLEQLPENLRQMLDQGSVSILNGDSPLEGLEPSERCPKCGRTLDDILQEQRFGCPHCYTLLGPRLGDLLEQAQGQQLYQGEAPAESALEIRIQATEQAIKRAMEKEDYLTVKTLKADLQALLEEGNL